MANKKISELSSRTPALSDLMIVGDPSSGYSYKCTVTALATIIETDIADGYVTIGTTQTISGAKTFSNNLTLTSVANATTTQTKFLTLNGSNVVNYRTGAEVLTDIGGQASLSGTGLVKSTSGTISYITDNSSNWNTAYNDSIVSAAVSGTTTKTLTLTQQDGGTLTASWSDLNTDAVTSVFGRTGAVVATEGDYSLNLLSDVTITSPSNGQVLKYNGTAWVNDTDANTGTVTSVGLSSATSGVTIGSTPITTSGTITLAIATASGSQQGLLSSTDWTTFNNKQNAITLTTTGTSGAATLVGSTLNIPQYQAALTNPVTGTGTTNYIPKFTSSSAIGNSNFITDASGNLGIGAVSLGSGLRLYVVQASGEGNPTLDGSEVALFQRNFVSAQSSSIAITSGSASTSSLYFGDKDNVSIGKLTYDNSSNAMIFNTNSSERMRLDASGNLGLGTSSPSYKLDVNGTISGATVQTTSRFIVNSTSNAGISDISLGSYANGSWLNTPSGTTGYLSVAGSAAYSYSKTIHSWYTDAGGGIVEKMRLDASGNLGLGVTPSAWRSSERALQIGATTSLYNVYGITLLGNNYFTNSSNQSIYINSAFATYYWQSSSDGSHQWSIAPSGTAGNVISWTQAMTLFSTGNLAVGGTSDAGYRLNVTGTGYFSGQVNAATYLTLSEDGTYTGTYYTLGFSGKSNGANRIFAARDGSDGIYFAAATNRGFEFRPNGGTTGALSIVSNGNVGIGTTSPEQLFTVAGGNISVSGNTGLPRQILELTTASTVSILRASYQGAGSFGDMALWTGGSERMRITSGGSLLLGTTTDKTTTIGATGTGQTIGGSGTTNLAIWNTGNADWVYSIAVGNDGTVYNYNKGNTPMLFSTNATERMRITSGGELLINTTSDAGDYKLQVNGNVRASNSYSSTTSTNNTNIGTSTFLTDYNFIGSDAYWGIKTTTTGKDFAIDTYNSGTPKNVLTITQAGNAEFGGSIKTAAPSGGTAKPWKLGEAGVTLGGSNTSGVRVEIDGVVYYLVTGYLP